jgi:hypothetical protein
MGVDLLILLTQFYGARQEKDEDISHWSCRLERIIGKCVDGGLVHHSEVDQQNPFWYPVVESFL